MTITLGGISLGVAYGDELVLRGLDAPAIALSSQRSEGGTLHILTAPLVGGRALELEGFITYAQRTAIEALIAAAAAVTLVHPRGTFSVLITATAFEDALTEYTNPRTTEWLTGTISMLEV